MPQNTQRQQPKSQDRAVPLSKDLVYTAMRQFPGYDQQTALALYLINKQEEQQKTDNDQTKLIRLQKQQNDKLTNVVKSLGQELDDLEQQSQQTDQEIERIKDLSGSLRGAGDVRQEVTKATAEQLKGLESQLAMIKNQSGMDPAKYKELVNQVNDIKSKQNLDPKEVAEIQNVLKTLQSKEGASKELFNKAMKQLQQTQQELDDKEGRFRSYIDRKGAETRTYAGDIQKYADIVQGYKKQIADFEKEVNAAKEQIYKARNDAKAKADELESTLTNFVVNQMKRYKTQPEQPADTQTSTLPGFSSDQEPVATATPRKVISFKPRAKQATGQEQLGKEMTQQAQQYGQLQESVIRISKGYPHDPEYEYWLKENLPYMVQEFKSTYWQLLQRKNPTYSDQQIAYTLEQYADWFYDQDPMEDYVDKFFKATLADLLKQPVEDERQPELNLREGLDKIYENMLDQIINETLSKNR